MTPQEGWPQSRTKSVVQLGARRAPGQDRENTWLGTPPASQARSRATNESPRPPKELSPKALSPVGRRRRQSRGIPALLGPLPRKIETSQAQPGCEEQGSAVIAQSSAPTLPQSWRPVSSLPASTQLSLAPSTLIQAKCWWLASDAPVYRLEPLRTARPHPLVDSKVQTCALLLPRRSRMDIRNA